MEYASTCMAAHGYKYAQRQTLAPFGAAPGIPSIHCSDESFTQGTSFTPACGVKPGIYFVRTKPLSLENAVSISAFCCA
ncbi:MAG: hypothetical protein JWM42_3785 [Burkholderia sp.]|jgi:hypothetical protein|nr:hypothetical protein [Burkholderia sp.]